MSNTRPVLIAYDIRDARRLRRVARCLESYAMRVQNSVFLARLSPADLADLRADLRERIDDRIDALRLYPLQVGAAIHYLGQPPLRSGIWLSDLEPIQPVPLALPPTVG